MKKILSSCAAVILTASLSTAVQAAPILAVGDIAFKFNDFTYADLDYPNLPGGAPLAPGGTGSGRTWGVAQVTSIHKIVAGNLESPILLSPVPIWTPSAGDFLQLRFGGLQLHGGHPAPAAFPYDLYFAKDSNTAFLKDTNGDGVGDSAYMEIYSRATDGFAADYAAGPGAGTYGSFGTNVAAGGTLWLDVALASGIIMEAGDAGADAADIEKSTISAITTAAATLYGDIIGGTAAGAFKDGVFPLIPIPGPPDPRADLKFKANLTAMFNPVTNTWIDPNGWTNESQDPVTANVVPEPATIILLGAGLVGVGFYSRRKRA